MTTLQEKAPTQARALAFLKTYFATNGVPASHTEIAQELGISTMSVREVLANLEKRGLISRKPRAHRSIRVLAA